MPEDKLLACFKRALNSYWKLLALQAPDAGLTEKKLIARLSKMERELGDSGQQPLLISHVPIQQYVPPAMQPQPQASTEQLLRRIAQLEQRNAEMSGRAGQRPLRRNNPEQDRQREADRAARNCFKCHKPGHRSAQCPASQQNKSAATTRAETAPVAVKPVQNF